ncbi:MAG: CoA-binding protein [Candidatus Zixiibacteriota bacterium]
MNDVIQTFVASKKIAVVGASPNKRSFANAAYCELKQKGYEVTPVNPNHSEVDGDRCASRLNELPPGVESALFVLTPTQAESEVIDAAATGIKRIWFQQGGKYDAAIRKAHELGIETVSGKCILMYAAPVKGVHAFHRWLSKLFGRY